MPNLRDGDEHVFTFLFIENGLQKCDKNETKKVKKASITCKNVERKKLKTFLHEDKGAVERKKYLTLPDDEKKAINLWVPPLTDVWSYLSDNPILEMSVQMRRGIHWLGEEKLKNIGINKQDLFSQEEKENFHLGHYNMKENLQQFSFKGHPLYLSLQPEVQENSSYKYDWNIAKVVCNAARFERKSPWRLAASIDFKGLAFTKRFFAFWPKSEELNLKLIAALLNSPIANAFIYAHDSERDNRIVTLKQLPIPEISALKSEGVEEITDEFLSFVEEHKNRINPNSGKAKKLLLRLDAAILKAYDLPPVLERQVLNLFQGYKRPVPFSFDGYYPPGFEANFPLHEIISEDFNKSLAENVLSIEPIKDKDFSKLVNLLEKDDL